MRLYFLRLGVILVTFIVAFFITTVIFDTIDQHSGYYDEGRRDSASVSQP